jgi:hypothetical protein
MTIDRKAAAAFTFLLLASGCTPNDINIGSTVRHNNAVQIVEPDPKYAEAQTANGAQVVGAQTRYRTDKVKKPKTIRTTEGGSNSGGAGGSSSSGGN